MKKLKLFFKINQLIIIILFYKTINGFYFF